jgi:hypothetical protein
MDKAGFSGFSLILLKAIIPFLAILYAPFASQDVGISGFSCLFSFSKNALLSKWFQCSSRTGERIKSSFLVAFPLASLGPEFLICCSNSRANLKLSREVCPSLFIFSFLIFVSSISCF